MVLRQLGLSGSTRTQVRRSATGRTTAARSAAPGRTCESAAAALRVWRAVEPLVRLPCHQARAVGRRVGVLGEVVGFGERLGWGGWAPGSAVSLVRRSRMGPTSHVSVRARLAGDRARKASRDPHHGPETCQQRYLCGVLARRRGFSTRGRGPNILAGIFPEILPRQQTERLPRCPFAPRMLRSARRPHCSHVSSEANVSRDAEAWRFWP